MGIYNKVREFQLYLEDVKMKKEVEITNYNRYSLASYYLELYYIDKTTNEEKKAAGATGFFIRQNNQDYFVTNYHVLSGKNSEDGTFNAEPETLRIYLPKKQEENFIYDGGKYVEIKLIDENVIPIWYEHPSTKNEIKKIDIAVIPAFKLQIPDDFGYETINELEEPFNENTTIAVADDVFVLGFPLEIFGGFLPIWKKGTVAFEPNIEIDELPKIYLDTATREGMSGSPVIYIKQRGVSLVESSTNKFSRNYTKFIGVYSSRIGVQKDESKALLAQLGLVWKANALEEIINNIEKENQ